MSMYNQIYWVDPATFTVLPMLWSHPDDYPRFRDCFIWNTYRSSIEKDMFWIPKMETTNSDTISVYTRVWWWNRESYQEAIDKLRAHENYLEDYDDEFDSTFATFVFSVPTKWKSDFDAIKSKKFNISREYLNHIKSIYPKIAEKIESDFSKYM